MISELDKRHSADLLKITVKVLTFAGCYGILTLIKIRMKEDLTKMDGDSSDDNTCYCNCLMKDCVLLAHLYHRMEWDRCAFLRFQVLLS